MEKEMETCLSYFRERKVYDKLFGLLREKYKSLGHLGGIVVLRKLSDEERRQLGGFMQKDYSQKEEVSISMKALQKALLDSRFSGITWEEILEAYYDEVLICHEEEKRLIHAKRHNFFLEIYNLYEAEDCDGKKSPLLWLRSLLEERGEGYQGVMQQYKESPEKLKNLLELLLKTLTMLPYKRGETQLLAVFAAAATGNPHFYDDKTPGERLLTSYLKFAFADEMMEGLSAPERRNRRLFAAGIVKDELSNYTMAYGILAKSKGGAPHLGIQGYEQMKEPVQISLWTLGEITELWQKTGNYVYVVENPSIFFRLVTGKPEIAAVCSNGQPSLATLILLDFLSRKSHLMYAGDFDPEGLCIAQRLKVRYGTSLSFWNYEKKYYDKFAFDVPLGEKRLKKLRTVTDVQLLPIKMAMEEKKRAAYQEAMIEELIADISDLT